MKVFGLFVFIFLCLQAYSLKSELNGTIIGELNDRYHQLDKFTRYRGVEKVQWVNFMYNYMCILSITSYLIGRIHGNIVNGDIYGNMYMFALCYIYLLWSIGYWVNNKKKRDVKVNEKVLEGHKQRLKKIHIRRLEKKLKMKNRDKQRLEHYAFINELVNFNIFILYIFYSI